MSNKAPHLYCCCIDQHHPRYFSMAPMTPVIGGATYLTKDRRLFYEQYGFAMDDTGRNISCLNPWFGDLTLLYWAWMNADDEHLGVCQYRRPWIEQDLFQAEEEVLYVPPPALFSSMERQYMDCHSVFNAPLFTRELAKQGRIPLTCEMVDEAWKQSKFYGCNMARGPKKLFDKYCSLVFDTIFPLWEEHQELCRSFDGYQRRSIAFAAERLITGIILNSEYFFGPNNVKEARIGFIG